MVSNPSDLVNRTESTNNPTIKHYDPQDQEEEEDEANDSIGLLNNQVNILDLDLNLNLDSQQQEEQKEEEEDEEEEISTMQHTANLTDPSTTTQLMTEVDHPVIGTTGFQNINRNNQLSSTNPIDLESQSHQRQQQLSNLNSQPLSSPSYPGRPAGLHPFAIPPLTLSQKLYIIFPQMIGAAIIDGAANFGIGCAMYLNAKNVRIWILQNNTVAGDMAVTIFIQGILTFCIASGMVHVALRQNKISAFEYPWPDTTWGVAKRLPPDEAKTKIGRLWRRFHNSQGFTRGLHFFSGSDVNDIFNRQLSKSQFFKRLFWSVWKGSILSVFYFFLIWPISMAIVTPIWVNDNLGNGNFTAPLIKAVYGFVYGFLMNPICAMIAMGSEDSVRHHRAEKQRERFENPDRSAMKTTNAERVSMANELARPTTGLLLPTSPIPSTHPPRRVESLRRSLDALGSQSLANSIGRELENPTIQVSGSSIIFATTSDSYGTGGGLAWKSVDVHRRRSLDTRVRSQSNGRYSRDSTDLTRSTSVGSTFMRPKRDRSGLFSSSGQLSTTTLDRTTSTSTAASNNHQSRSNIIHPHNRMRTLSEHSIHPTHSNV